MSKNQSLYEFKEFSFNIAIYREESATPITSSEQKGTCSEPLIQSYSNLDIPKGYPELPKICLTAFPSCWIGQPGI